MRNFKNDDKVVVINRESKEFFGRVGTVTSAYDSTVIDVDFGEFGEFGCYAEDIRLVSEMKFVPTRKTLVEKKSGARYDVVINRGVEGVKSVDFWGGVTSCNDPIMPLECIVLENFNMEVM